MPSNGYGSSGPNTSNVADIAARGQAAIDDRKKAMSFNSTQARQALDWVSQQLANGVARPYNPTVKSDAYSAWFDSMNSAPTATNGQGGYIYGQTSKGAYAGYKNESDLKNAIAGAASMQRGSTNDLLAQFAQHAQQNLDSIQQQRDQAIHDWAAQAYHNPNAYDAAAGTGPTFEPVAGDTESFLAGSGSGKPTPTEAAVQQWARGMWGHPAGSDKVNSSISPVRPGGLGKTTQPPGTTQPRSNEFPDDYQKQLDEWYATQADKQLSGQEFATQAMQAPITAYERQVAAQYGVDPNLAAGWFGDQQALADWRTQRDMQSIQDYGMPYSEWSSYLAGRQSDQTKAQTAAEKAAAADQEAQMTAAVADATGGKDITQLSQSADVPTDIVYAVTTSGEFQQARDGIASALDAYADPTQRTADNNGSVASITKAVNEAVQLAMRTGAGDAMLAILQDLYPDAFNAYQDNIYGGQNAIGG